jgi:ABC-type oligopeptide transport system ATPase subunit
MALLDVRALVKTYRRGEGFFDAAAGLRAVDGVSFDIEASESFGLVGESGCGKTTTGRCILRLVEPTSGRVILAGRDVLALSRSALRDVRREMQIVFQDPMSSLNPRMTVRETVEEPLAVHHLGSPAERLERVVEIVRLVGLDESLLDRRPREFSVGQRQRIGLARALVLRPSFVVLDEPVASLDVSVQAQVLNLLMDLQERLSLTYLFIAHDLRVVQHTCSRVAVMYRGRIVEQAPTDAIFGAPAHPYTRALLSAMPVPDPTALPMRVEWDAQNGAIDAPLREVGPAHFAAIP